ncbi:hypothetical protein SAMN04488490_0768 [Marinobacter sp. LV10R510-11A]|uniref:hypothetical protein n=1 Tax=Marinobacter sp. LV10R510-11A TaxID=1415568 RepID=UPI000BC00154|nr:hypothetical protein [Marinobacter sp. LV10R510-11A]SOB75204.1 hypothetical protein SAMN04488490_0768 [Marinobacter sp. LV10R510-11A]
MKNTISMFARLAMIFVFVILLPSFSFAQSGGDTEKEIRVMVQKQFERMYQKGIGNLSDRIVVSGGVKPFAVVTDTGDKVKTIRIKQIEEMHADMALEVLRRSLVALVKKGKIGATAIFYTADNPNQESNAEKVLVVEMEHIFGPTLAQLVPFTVKEGKAAFGDQVVVDMEKQMFNLKIDEGAAG